MYKITLNRVHDRVRFTEGEEHLDLRVDADPMRMTAGLMEAQKRLKLIKEEMTDEEKAESARYFAGAIFGAEQAERLMDFYFNDAACVIKVCGQYFQNRLSKLIAKAQKRMK